MSARRLAVVTAGLSRPSSTRMLADQLAAASGTALLKAGAAVVVEVVELRDVAGEIVEHLLSGHAGPGLAGVLAVIEQADAVIVVSPVFNASYSGLFKMFFDIVEPHTVAGKPALLAAAAGVSRHSLVLEHALRPLFAYLRMITVPTAVFAATQDWGTEPEQLANRIHRAADEFAALIEAREHARGARPGSWATLPPSS